MASERIKFTQVLQGANIYMSHPGGTHITLPLDANALDAEAVEAAAMALHGISCGLAVEEWDDAWQCIPVSMKPVLLAEARAALAAYANHVAGGAK